MKFCIETNDSADRVQKLLVYLTMRRDDGVGKMKPTRQQMGDESREEAWTDIFSFVRYYKCVTVKNLTPSEFFNIYIKKNPLSLSDVTKTYKKRSNNYKQSSISWSEDG